MRLGPYTLSSNLFLSPLAGYTNLPMRLTVRELGGLGWIGKRAAKRARRSMITFTTAHGISCGGDVRCQHVATPNSHSPGCLANWVFSGSGKCSQCLVRESAGETSRQARCLRQARVRFDKRGWETGGASSSVPAPLPKRSVSCALQSLGHKK